MGRRPGWDNWLQWYFALLQGLILGKGLQSFGGMLIILCHVPCTTAASGNSLEIWFEERPFI